MSHDKPSAPDDVTALSVNALIGRLESGASVTLADALEAGRTLRDARQIGRAHV
jgi:hypothetical protein